MSDAVLEESPPETPDQPEPAPEPEPEQAPEPEPEPEPEQTPEALSEREISKRIDALEREKDRHAKRVSEILQEEALDLIECEACEPAIPGFHYPAHMYATGSAQQTLYELLAGGTDAQMKHPERYVTCGTCNGFGQVLTGARNDLTRLITCPECKGAGYHDRQDTATQVVPLQPAPPAENGAADGWQQPTDADFLGRPRGHPNFGKMTTYLTPEELAIDQRDGFGV